MDIKELESFRMSDAVKFHNKLNPALWTEKAELDPEVQAKLMEIARDFMSELGLGSLKVSDITISGSNAAFSYTPHSDLDLHILVDFNKLPDDEVYRELFNAKKTLYNDTHDIKVHGVPVELYVQDTNQSHASLGEYSLLHKKWLKFPIKRRANFDQNGTRLKYEKLGELIQLAIKQRDVKKIERVLDIIKRYRKAGLESAGEFGPENLAFKALRSQGYIQKLYDLKNELHSKKLSIESAMDEDWHPNDTPPGPETKPTMPQGTVRVDVSDVYDWYKLGQNISNLDRVDKSKFGKGPPSTIMAFGDEDIEHKYIKALQDLGLTTTDIDPIDPKQPKNMPRQKVDPTYNVGVAESFDKPYPITWEKGQFGDIDALATLDDGSYLSIMFNKLRAPPSSWMVEFYRNNSQDITGEGDAHKVFATVLKAVEQFVKKVKPKNITFSSVKEADPKGTRTKLYDRLVQRYAAGLGYAVSKEKHPQETHYDLKRLTKSDQQGVAEGIESNNIAISLSRLGKFHKGLGDPLAEFVPERATARYALHPEKWESTFFSLTNKDPRKLKYYGPKKIEIPPGTLVGDMAIANQFYWAETAEEKQKYAEAYRQSLKPYPVDVSQYSMPELLIPRQGVAESTEQNFVYHVTPTKNLKSIAKYGLKPSVGDRSSKIKDEKKGIYVFPDKVSAEDAVMNWLGDEFDDEPLTMLKIDITGLHVSKGADYELILDTVIEPNRIKKVKVDLGESASGYIPSNAEKDDPRFKTALTVDIKPDTLKKNAKAFGFDIARSGIPPQLRASGKYKTIKTK